MSALQINGNDLSFNDLREAVYDQRPVELADSARTKVVAAREVVEKLLRENRVAYAINTTFDHVAYHLSLPLFSGMAAALYLTTHGGDLEWIRSQDALGNV